MQTKKIEFKAIYKAKEVKVISIHPGTKSLRVMTENDILDVNSKDLTLMYRFDEKGIFNIFEL